MPTATRTRMSRTSLTSSCDPAACAHIGKTTFTLYQGYQEPKEEDIIMDAHDIDGEGSINGDLYTIPNPMIDATQCVTIVNFISRSRR